MSNTGFSLLNSFSFYVQGNTVYTTGYSGVAKSADGGLNWTSLSPGFSFGETGLDIWADGTNVLSGTSVSRHRSSDDGATWTAPVNGFGSGGVSSFAQIDSTLFAGNLNAVYKSTDHGANWTSTGALGASIGVQSLVAAGLDLFAGTSDGVYRSSNQGGTWTPINQGLASKTFVRKIAADDQYLYAGTNTRSVWRRLLSEITAVEEISSNLPAEFGLSQNYPNPFNPRTSFNFRVLERGLVTLRICDVLGREIATLVNDELRPGTYQTSWDASGQPSGVYYYRLQAGNVREVGKMILSK